MTNAVRTSVTRCWIALGGNVGDVSATLRSALDRIDASPGVDVRSASRLYDTTPVGAAAGARFFNAAAELEVEVSPPQLLDLLQRVESELGRTRDVRWGPRTIDLDLLLWGEACIRSERLTVPHPALWYRRFVLDPLVEIAPHAVHPRFGLTIRQLRERLLERPLPVAVAGTMPSAGHLRRLLTEVFPDQIRITADLSSAAIVLDLCGGAEDQAQLPVNSVRLVGSEDAPAAATAVLTAALDEPHALDPPLRNAD